MLRRTRKSPRNQFSCPRRRVCQKEGRQCKGLPTEDISEYVFSASSSHALLPLTKADAHCPIKHGVFGITRTCRMIILHGMEVQQMHNSWFNLVQLDIGKLDNA